MSWKSRKGRKGKKSKKRALRTLRPLSPLSSPNHSQMTQKTLPPQFNWDHWEIVCCQSPGNKTAPAKSAGAVLFRDLAITIF